MNVRINNLKRFVYRKVYCMYMKHALQNKLVLLCATIFLLGASPAPLFAASDLEVSGWIPYWAAGSGTRDARKHLNELSVIFPFAYAVKDDGSLTDLAKLKKSTWKKLFSTARKKDILIIPTVMWSNTYMMHAVLSNEDSREEHVEEIGNMVRKGKYDGVDIDYEGKLAETHDAFALFLGELKAELGRNKILSCTIEARTPPDSLYKTMPADLRYANDFNAIAKYCDRVNIMTYDQQRADIKLNEAHAGEPYIPVSDPAWVRKVIELTLQTIPKEKISLGIPTYGHEYEVVVYSDAYQAYNKTGAFNPSYGIKTARHEKVTPERSDAGELSFSFPTLKNAPQFNGAVSIPNTTSDASRAAVQSFTYTRQTGLPSVFYYATWSDAEAIRQKVNLAKEYDLQGVAIFKFDGNEDKEMWNVFE